MERHLLHQAFFSARSIGKQYPGTRALDAVDFDLHPGEVHALVGENGAGKSTLMQIMAGVLRPDAGSMVLDGHPLHLHNPHQAQQVGISLVFQELALAPNMSVAENIFTNTQPGNRFGLIRFDDMYDKARQALADFGFEVDPRTLLRVYPVAVQQIVEIARATQRRTRMLLLDEPTSAIGEREIERLFQVIRKLVATGVGVVYVTHKLDEVFAIADRITVLKDGKRVNTVQRRATNQSTVVQMMVGRTFDSFFPPRAVGAGNPLLETRKLTGRGFTDVNLAAQAGEILGLFGQTGSGRTELARCLFGSDPIESGEVLLSGKPVQITSPQDAMRKGLAYIPEDRKQDGLFLAMSLAANLAATNLTAVSRHGFISNRRLTDLASAIRHKMQIKAHNLEQPVSALSGGNQQKVLFGKWLARRPMVLIADEPTRGVDIGAKEELYVLLRAHAKQGAAVIVISSELPEIMGLCDRVKVMRSGRIVGTFLPAVDSEDQVLACAIGAETADSAAFAAD